MASLYSSESSQPSEKQLKQVLKNIKYPHHIAAAKQIASSLDSLPDLKTSIKEYTHKDGKKMDLMLLDATIPAKLSDFDLGVPINIWLLRNFPKECPLVFVMATAEFGLTSVSYVDEKGKIKLPYLVDWKETRSDLSTLGKMLKYKFGQQCPVQPLITKPAKPLPPPPSSSFPSTYRQQSSLSQGSFRMSDSIMYNSLTTSEPPILDPNLLHVKIDLEKKDREISSYKKTIKALTEELDGLGKRVKELEHAQRAGSKDTHGKGKVDKATAEELENVKEEKATYQELLKEQTERLQLEIQEKEVIQRKLNSKISDLTQTREKVAILEVDLEDCQQKLQRTLKELRQSKNETREFVAINKELKAQIATLAELDSRSSTHSDSYDTERLENANLRIQQLEDYLSEAQTKITSLNDEKKEMEAAMATMTKDFQQVEDELIHERDDLERQLFVDAKEFVSVECQTDAQVSSEMQDQPFVVPLGSSIRQKFKTINHWTQTDSKMGCCDKEIEEESLREEDVSMHKEEIQQLRRELEEKKVESNKTQKELEEKVLQLLGFRDTLSNKNNELQKQIKDLQEQKSEAGTEHYNRKEIDNKHLEEEIQRLKGEKEDLKLAHAKEKQDIVKKIGHIKESMLKKNAVYEGEIEDLKEQIKKISLRAQNSAPDLLGSVSVRSSNENIISSKEIKITGIAAVQEGSWGYVMEGSFRGTLVGVRVISTGNIKRFSVPEVYQQVSTLASLRHPNIVLFVAAAMDTQEGMLLVTEFYTRTLRQVLQEAYSAGINRLPAMLDIALALNYLHLQSKPVAHGNLSTNCVVIREVPGQPWKAKLTDIGLAAPCILLNRPEEMSVVYKDPVESNDDPDKKPTSSSDAYSYGVLLGEASLAVETTDIQELSPLLVSFVKDQFPAIFSLIQACLSLVPEQRPTMEVLISKIQHLVVNRVKLTAVST